MSVSMITTDKILDLSQTTFNAELARSTLPLLIDFTANWCPPCRLLVPHLSAIAESYAGRLRVAQVNSDDNPLLTERFGVMSVPTLLLLKNGVVVGQIVGAVPRARIEELIQRAL